MSAPLLARAPPTCLSCLRRSFVGSSPSSSSSTTTTTAVAAAVGLTQVRGKKTKGRQYDPGVVVRLLKDVKQFGPKHSIFLAPRGRMRNMWYPSRKAEYMTAARFAELGLTRDAIGERDPLFGLGKNVPSEEVKVQKEVVVKAADRLKDAKKTITPIVMPPEPEQAAVLLQSVIPDVITFRRKVMPPKKEEAPKPYRNPLLATNATVSTAPDAVEEPEPEPAAAAHAPIFGSVSTADLAHSVRQMLLGHDEAARISIKEEHFHIQGIVDDKGNPVQGATKVRTLGRWTISISIPHEGDAPQVKPVVKHFEVVEDKA